MIKMFRKRNRKRIVVALFIIRKRNRKIILVALFIIVVYTQWSSYAPTAHSNRTLTGSSSQLTKKTGHSSEIKKSVKIVPETLCRYAHHSDWRNNTLYFHTIHYNLQLSLAKKQANNKSAKGKQAPVSQQVPLWQQQLGAFGKVVIANDSSLSLTKTTATLTDQVNIAPADCLCIHTPPPPPPDDAAAADDPPPPAPTLALATTVLFSGKQHFLINNTITNWGDLRPFVQPVLYVTLTSNQDQPHAHATIKHACNVGWDVYVVPESNPNNFPVLRTMMADLLHKYSTPLVGYANGDILFDKSLQETLEFFLKHKKKITKNVPHHLITGRRKDILVSRPGFFYATSSD